MAKRSPGSVRGTATEADPGCHGGSGATGQTLGEEPIHPARPFAGSFCRAGGGTGCACSTGSQGTLHRTRVKGEQREKIQAMDSFIWSLTPISQGHAGARAQCLCCSPAAGHDLDQGGHDASREDVLADLAPAHAVQDPSSARGSCRERGFFPKRAEHLPAPVCSVAPVQPDPCHSKM